MKGVILWIKKIASNYIYCGLLTTAFGCTAAGLRGSIYTKKLLDRAISHPEEVLELILTWPILWYKVGKSLYHNKPKKD